MLGLVPGSIRSATANSWPGPVFAFNQRAETVSDRAEGEIKKITLNPVEKSPGRRRCSSSNEGGPAPIRGPDLPATPTGQLSVEPSRLLGVAGRAPMTRRRKDAREFDQKAMSLKDFARVMGIDYDTARTNAVVIPNGERPGSLPPGKFPCRRIGNVTRVLMAEVIGNAEQETSELDGQDHRPTAEGDPEGDAWRRPLRGLHSSGRAGG